MTTLTSKADTTTARINRKPKTVVRSGRTAIIFAVIAVVVIGAAATYYLSSSWQDSAVRLSQMDKFVVAPRTFNVVLKEKGELKASKSADIKCEVEGRSTIISLIDEGKLVTKGDMLVELASDEIENRIQQEELKEANAVSAFEAAKAELDIQRDKNESDNRKASLKIELAQLELDKYRKGDWIQQLKDAEIAISQARIMLEREKEDFEAAKELVERKFITRTEFKEDEFNYQKAQWDLEKADRAKNVLEEYTHIANLRRSESDLEEAGKEALRVQKSAEAEETKKVRALEGKEKELNLTQTQLEKLKRQRKQCRIFAPTSGYVVYYSGGGGHRFMSGQNQIQEGAEVRERQILMQLPDTTQMAIVLRVHEAKMDRLAVGQKALVEIEGIPGKRFSGNVSKIAVLADTQNRWLNPDLKEYETEILLDETDEVLKPGATAHVEIMVETVVDKLAVPVQAIYSKGGKRYAFHNDRGAVSPREIQLGAIGMEWAEVVNGLQSDDQILLAFSDEQKRMIPDAAPGASRGKRARPGANHQGPSRGMKRTKPGQHPKGAKRVKAVGQKPGQKQKTRVLSTTAEKPS